MYGTTSKVLTIWLSFVSAGHLSSASSFSPAVFAQESFGSMPTKVSIVSVNESQSVSPNGVVHAVNVLGQPSQASP